MPYTHFKGCGPTTDLLCCGSTTDLFMYPPQYLRILKHHSPVQQLSTTMANALLKTRGHGGHHCLKGVKGKFYGSIAVMEVIDIDVFISVAWCKKNVIPVR